MAAMWSDKKEFIFKAVEEMYTDVASRPGALFHFPTGRLACLFVGYPAEQLDGLPSEATESFAGVGSRLRPMSSVKATRCWTSAAAPAPTH